MTFPEGEYIIFQINSGGKSKDGFSSVSQDLVIVNTNKCIDFKGAIGKIGLTKEKAFISFKNKKDFSLIEKICTIFDIDNFDISVSEDDNFGNLNQIKDIEQNIKIDEEVNDQKNQSEEQQAEQNTRILRKALTEVFTCPHLVEDDGSFDFENPNKMRGMSSADAYNCLMEKHCPIKNICMEQSLFENIKKVVDFNKYDMFILDFINHGEKYSFAIGKKFRGIVPSKKDEG